MNKGKRHSLCGLCHILLKSFPLEYVSKEVVSLGLYLYKTNDTLHKDCESVIVGYIL